MVPKRGLLYLGGIPYLDAGISYSTLKIDIPPVYISFMACAYNDARTNFNWFDDNYGENKGKMGSGCGDIDQTLNDYL